jgi:hypothetical protein
MEQAQHVSHEKNQKDRTGSYTGSATRTPPGMAVITATRAKNKQ